MSCKRITKHNNSESLLFDKLLEIHNDNEDKAQSSYEYFHSPKFKEEFGDWLNPEEAQKMLDRVDENFEPQLFYDNASNKHYYTNKDGEKMFYPHKTNRLRSVFNYNEIGEISNFLLLKYLKSNPANAKIISLDETSKLEKLEDFIKNELNMQMGKLMTSSSHVHIMNGLRVEEAMTYMDDIVDSVEKAYKKLGLKRKEYLDNPDDNFEESEEEQDAETPRELIRKNSLERDTKDSVSSNIKLKLSLLEHPTDKDSIFNETKLIPFGEIYGTLLNELSNTVAVADESGNLEDSWDLMVDKIKKILPSKPYLSALLNQLESFSERDKNEFVQAFNLHSNNYLASSIKLGEGAIVHKTQSISKSGSKRNIVTDTWFGTFSKRILNSNGSIKEDIYNDPSDPRTPQQYLANVMGLGIHTVFNAKDKTTEELIAIHKKMLDALDVYTTEEGYTRFLEKNGEIAFNEEAQRNHVIDSIAKTNKGIQAIKDELAEYAASNYDYELPNLFNLGEQIFNEIAESQAYFLSEGSDASIQVGNKQYWLFSYPSYVSTRVLSWKKDRNNLLALYNSSAFTKGSKLMKWLLNIEEEEKVGELGTITEETDVEDKLKVSLDRIKNFDVGIFSTLNVRDKEGNNTATDTTDLSFQDYFIDHVNKVLANDYVRTITPADKATDLQLRTGLFIKTSPVFVKGKMQLDSSTINIFKGYFEAEFNRMIEDKQVLDSGDKSKIVLHYHLTAKGKPGNAFQSQLFPELSPNSDTKNPLAIAIKNKIYNTEGFPNDFKGISITDDTSEFMAEINQLLSEYINEQLAQNIITTGELFKQNGILADTTEGDTLIKGINSKTSLKYLKESAHKNKALLNMVSDFYINSIIQNVEYSKMFTGDPAYYKNMVDFKKRIPATYTDGLQLRLKSDEQLFNIATISSIIIDSPFLTQLRETIGKTADTTYTGINSADGQSWITPQRWEFLTKKLGLWTDVHETLYKKMLSKEPQQYTQDELKVGAQPLKGVYFEINNGIPTFLKYSQAVLSPNLIKDTDLQKIYDKMTKDENGNYLAYNDQIHEVITVDGIKTGSLIPDTIHNSDGSVKDNFVLTPQTLKNSGWKLQQNLPTKTFHDTEVGSQIQKNIFGGLLFNRDLDFYHNDEKLSGQQIIDRIVDTTNKLSEKGLNNIIESLGISPDGKIKNKSKVYNGLIEDLIKRDGSQNVIDALRKGLSITAIPQLSTKLKQMLIAKLNREVIKIKTNGGSFIQMSNFGLSKTEADSKGVIWHPDADNTTNEPYIVRVENGRKVIKPGGVLISGSFLAKYIPNYKEYTPKQLFGTINSETGKREGGIVDPKILDNVIGYRIPNQGLSSNDALNIVGILPEENGDTIVAYTGITSKTGSDFDIDKMYVMFPSFTKDGAKLVYADSSEDTVEGLQNRLIELYKSVLTNPEVLKDVMKSIDNPLISREINSLLPDVEKGSLYHFDSYHDIELMYSFRGGKAGVGQEANAMVDINRVGELHLKNYYIGKGNSVIKDGMKSSKLDEEFSEELNKEDLDYYLGVLTKENPDESAEDLYNEIYKVKISDSLVMILNAFVDIAKDPFITRGNWVTSTTNTGNLLLRSGVHPITVINFMAQPIIKDYINFINNNESALKDVKGDSKSLFLESLLLNTLDTNSSKYSQFDINLKSLYLANKKMFKNVSEIDMEAYAKTLSAKTGTKISEEQAREIVMDISGNIKKVYSKPNDSLNPLKSSLKQLREQITVKTDPDFQLAVLNKFYELQELSKGVRENVDLSKLDTKGLKSPSSVFKYANLRQIIKNKSLSDIKGVLIGVESKFNNTILGNYYNNIVNKMIPMVSNNSDLFPETALNIQQYFNEISDSIYNEPLINDDLISSLEKSYNTYLLAKSLNISPNESRDLVKNFPQEFLDYKTRLAGQYRVLDELQWRTTEGLSIIAMNNRKKSSSQEIEFVDSWRDLMEEHKEFAEKLIKYSIVTSGFQMSRSQFFTYIPHEFFLEQNLNRKLIVQSRKDQAEFIDLYFKNNSDSSLIKTVYNSNLVGINTVKPESASLAFKMDRPGKSPYYVKNEKGELFKLEGYDEYNKGIYTRTEKLGFKISGLNILEYNGKFSKDDVVGLESNPLVLEARSKVRADGSRNKFDANYKLEITPEAINTVTTDRYSYYGREYSIELTNGLATNVNLIKGQSESVTKFEERKAKILNAYNENPNVDPQNNKTFRIETKATNLNEVVPEKDETGKNIIVASNSSPNNTVIFEDDNNKYLMNDGQQKAYDDIVAEAVSKLAANTQVTSADLKDFHEFTTQLSTQFNGVIPSKLWNNMIGLAGRGGTGKTTVVNAIIEKIKQERGSTSTSKYSSRSLDYVYLAKTHTAATILQESLGRDSEKANDGLVNTVPSFTKRSMPNLQGGLDMVNEEGYIASLKFGTPISKRDLIIIDESSMIGVQDLKDIMTRIQQEIDAGQGGKMPVFLFMGDYRQLGPVDTAPKAVGQINKDIIASTLLRDTSKTHELTQVMRSKNQILHDLYDAIGNEITFNMDNVDNGLPATKMSFNNYDELSKESSENILVVKDKEGIIDDYVTYLTENNNPYGMMWLHYNNVNHPATKELTAKIRDAYFKKAGLEFNGREERPFSTGDYVEYNGTTEMSSSDEQIPVNTESKIFDILSDKLKSNGQGQFQVNKGYVKPRARFKVLDIYPNSTPIRSLLPGPITSRLSQETREMEIPGETFIMYTRQNNIRAVKQTFGLEIKKLDYNKQTKHFNMELIYKGEKIASFSVHYGDYKNMENDIKIINMSKKAPFSYSYVGSSHTAQGNSIKNVIAGEDNVKQNLAKGVSQDDIFSSLYTVLTRTAGSLAIVKPQNAEIVENFDVFQGFIQDDVKPKVEEEEDIIEPNDSYTLLRGEDGTYDLMGPDGIVGEYLTKQEGLDLMNKLIKESKTKEVVGENIISRGSAFAKQLTNVGNTLGLNYKGQFYLNAEHAYQTWKSGEFNQEGYNLKGGKVRGGKIGDTYSIMTDILTEKLRQHPFLVEGITERGGLEYLSKSTHNVIGDKFWETEGGQNQFVNALTEAYKNVYESQGSDKINKPGGLPGIELTEEDCS